MSLTSSVVGLTSTHPWAATFLVAVGAFSFARFALKTVRVFADIFVLPGTNLKKFGAKSGAWAVVTGATDGIGREFALQLARAGFNIIIAARNPAKLDETAQAIAKQSADVQTAVVVIDFSRKDDAQYAALASMLAGRNIGVLVNNVGKSHAIPVDFVDTPRAEFEDIIEINIAATLRVTQLVLPSLIARKNGLVLNVGSFSGAIPSPMLATYSASKAFLSTWSDALAAELRPRGVLVQHLNTYFVVSAMSKIRRPSFTTPTARDYVVSVLTHIGLAGGSAHTGRPSSLTPYTAHALADWGIGLLPNAWRGLFIGYSHNLHKDIRRRALRKAEREAKKA